MFASTQLVKCRFWFLELPRACGSLKIEVIWGHTCGLSGIYNVRFEGGKVILRHEMALPFDVSSDGGAFSEQGLSKELGSEVFQLHTCAAGGIVCGPGGNEPGPKEPGREGGDEGDGRTGVVIETRPKTKRPRLFKVLLLNDDYTPMEFVVHVLERFFGKDMEEATEIMLHVHHKGVGICGVYTYEVAETKVTQVTDFSRKHQHPLQCTMEKE